MSQIVVFDNGTGIDIPHKIDVYPVDLILGGTVSAIMNNIKEKTKLFIVFTKVQDADFVTYNIDDKEYLEELLKFGKYNYKVEQKDPGIWYTNKAAHCIIVSDTVHMNSKELSELFGFFLNKNNIPEIKEMYIVTNSRNRKILLRTPIYDEAVEKCNTEPCGIIIRRSDRQTIYRSNYGKVAIPYGKEIENKKKPKPREKVFKLFPHK